MNIKGTKEFERLYKSTVNDVFRYLSLRLSDRERVIDLTQETYVRIWNSYFRLEKDIENERALLFKIAHNLLVNAYERDRKSTSLDEMSEKGMDVTDESEDVELRAESGMIVASIDRLEGIYKEALFLRFVEGLAVPEIANLTEESENVISVRIHRGLKKLKEIYGR